MSGEAAWQAAESLATWAWRASWQGAALAAGVGVVLWIMGGRISPAWRFALWSLVLVRLAMPSMVEIKLGRTERNIRSQASIIDPAPIPASHARASAALSALTQAEIAAAMQESDAASPSATTPNSPATPTTNHDRTWSAIGSTAKRPAAAIWLAGVVLLLSKVVWSSIRLARAVRRTPVIDDPRVRNLMAACCRELRIRRVPRARALPGAGAPALVGFLQPTVLLPTRVIQDMGDEELRLILMHELAHVKRRDVLIGWLATLVAVMHWPNPAGWIVGWRMRAERELACDEMVMRAGRGGGVYARTIVKLVEALSLPSASSSSSSGVGLAGRVPAAAAAIPSGAIGILEGKSQIQRRLLMIARFEATGRRWPAVAAGLGLIVGAMALSGITRAAEPPLTGGPPGATAAAKPGERTDKSKPDAKPAAATGAPAAESGGGAADPSRPQAKPRLAAMAAYAGPTSPEDDAANARTAAKLKKTVDKVSFNGQGFSDVVEFLRDSAQVDILVEWNALEQAGITRDVPVTLQLREPAPLDAVLILIFRSMGLGLQYELEKGVVVIGPSTSQPAAVMRVYDVSDLISRATTAAPIDGPGPGPAAGAGGNPVPGGFGGGGFASDGQNREIDQLIHLIVTTVEPNTWRDAGGDLGSITAFKNKLVVKTAEGVHKEIAALLEMLRDKPAGPAAKEKTGY